MKNRFQLCDGNKFSYNIFARRVVQRVSGLMVNASAHTDDHRPGICSGNCSRDVEKSSFHGSLSKGPPALMSICHYLRNSYPLTAVFMALSVALVGSRLKGVAKGSRGRFTIMYALRRGPKGLLPLLGIFVLKLLLI
jgi:hypothetical protein